MDSEPILKDRTLSSYTAYIWNAALFIMVLSGIIYIVGLHQYLGFTIYRQQYFGWFLGLMLFCIFLSRPLSKKSNSQSVPWYDWILAFAGLGVGLYVFIYYPVIVYEMSYITTDRFIVSVIAVFLIIEALRRMIGWILVIIILLFMSYSYISPFLPGPLKGISTPSDVLFNYLFLDANSMLSMLGIAATIALAFILLGTTLLNFKGGDILNDLSLLAFGRFRGGPAKASVVGSSVVGSITGGPVTNVMLTGTVTIPLMKRSGYTSVQAGAIEAVASSGGSILPPIMGITAFVIAENLGIPYAEVALAALIPALLYYFCLFIQVDFIAGKQGIKKLSKDELPSFKQVMSVAWLIVPPFFVLIYALFFMGLTPSTSGLYATVTAIVFLILPKAMRAGLLKRLISIFTDTGKVLLDIGIILAGAGLVVGIMGVTGLGFNIALSLSVVAEYGLFPLLVVSAIASIVLGMGMPTIAAYSLVAVLVTPTLVDLGVVPMAAHLFVFYFAVISNFTPPIAMASFAAAPIAQANPNHIGYAGMKLAIVSYIIPFIFVYSPEILLSYDPQYTVVNIVASILVTIYICFLLTVSVVGYLFKTLSKWTRIMFAGFSGILILSFVFDYPIPLFVLFMFIPLVVIAQLWWSTRVHAEYQYPKDQKV